MASWRLPVNIYTLLFLISGKINIPLKNGKDFQHQIELSVSSTLKVDESLGSSESYKLTIQSPSTITIVGSDRAGVFYGIQSLLNLVEGESTFPGCEIEDQPRYEYRGMHLDVSRNFHSKAQVLKLLDVMAMYKMNKFHFHLTDDEGWRLEIPGLEELTQVC